MIKIPRSQAMQTSYQILANFGYRIIVYILGFGVNLLLAKTLGVEQYGTYSLCLTIIGSMVAFVSLGMPRAVVREISGHGDAKNINQSFNTGFLWTCIIGIFGAACLISASSWLTTRIFANSNLEYIIVVAAVFIPIIAINSILGGVFEGIRLSSHVILIKEIIGKCIKICIYIIIGIVFTFNTHTIIWAYVCSELIISFIFLFSLQKYKIKLAIDSISWAYQKKFLSYSIIHGGSVVSNMVWANVSGLVIGFYLTSTHLGLYNVALIITSIILFGLGAINIVVMPLASSAFKGHDHGQLQYLYHASSNLIAVVTIPIFATVICYGNVLLSLFGKDFLDAQHVLNIVCIGALINAITGANYPFLIMSAHYRYETYLSISAGLLTVITAFLLIPRFEIVGAAFSYLFVQCYVNISRCVYLYKYYNITPFSRTFGYYIVCTLLLFLIKIVLSLQGWLSEFFQAMIFLSVSALIIASCYFYLVSSKDEKQIIDMLINKLCRTNI